MDVNYQRANTCYKQTEEATDWLSARAQCWSYGGDLAFPLPKDDEECRARIWSKGEEVIGSFCLYFCMKKYFIDRSHVLFRGM